MFLQVLTVEKSDYDNWIMKYKMYILTLSF